MQRKNLGSMLARHKNKKGGFLGPMLGLLAPVVGKLIGGLIPKRGRGINGFGDGIKGYGEGHPKTKSGKGVFDVVKKLATGPLAKMAKDALKKKLMEVAVNKSVDLENKKLSKGSGMKRSKKMHSMKVVGVPSYNKNAIVTMTKPMKEIKNPIKAGRKKDVFM